MDDMKRFVDVVKELKKDPSLECKDVANLLVKLKQLFILCEEEFEQVNKFVEGFEADVSTNEDSGVQEDILYILGEHCIGVAKYASLLSATCYKALNTIYKEG